MQFDRVLSALANETSDITCSYLMKAKFNYLVLVVLFIENISNLSTIYLLPCNFPVFKTFDCFSAFFGYCIMYTDVCST